MNSKCETATESTCSMWLKPIFFEMANEPASNALKLRLSAYGEINRGPKLCTEYISHHSNFKINSAFDQEPIWFPCDYSDMLQLPHRRCDSDSSVLYVLEPTETPHPHSLLKENHSEALQWCNCEITNTWAPVNCEHWWNSGDWVKSSGPQCGWYGPSHITTSKRNHHLWIYK